MHTTFILLTGILALSCGANTIVADELRIDVANVLVIDGLRFKAESDAYTGIQTFRMIGLRIPAVDHPGRPKDYVEKAIERKNHTTLNGVPFSIILSSDLLPGVANPDRELPCIVVLPDGVNYNEELLRKGYACVEEGYVGPYAEEFVKAENEARLAAAGYWGIGKTPVSTDIRDYIRTKLLNNTFYLRVDALRLVKNSLAPDYMLFRPGVADVTNVMPDGIHYRQEGMSDRSPDGFIGQVKSNTHYQWYMPQVIRRGEQIRVHEVFFKRDMYVPAFSTPGRQSSEIFFLPGKNLDAVTREEVDRDLSLVFANSPEELEEESTQMVAIGMTEAEVRACAGSPKAKLVPQSGVIVYVYDAFKVIFHDGVVAKIDF